MKTKTALIFIASILSSTVVFSQDTSQNQKLSQNKSIPGLPANTHVNSIENHTYYNNSPQYKNIPQYDNSIHVYRDTRLGSSSPLYNTYQKNDNGAGAITTNPNKGSEGAPLPTAGITNPVPMDSATMQNNSYRTDSANKK